MASWPPPFVFFVLLFFFRLHELLVFHADDCRVLLKRLEFFFGHLVFIGLHHPFVGVRFAFIRGLLEEFVLPRPLAVLPCVGVGPVPVIDYYCV